MSELITVPDAVDRVAMVVRRGSDGVPRFAASGFVLATRLVICAGHGLARSDDTFEVRLPGRSAIRVPVTAVVRHRIHEVDLALLVLGEGAPPLSPARWGVLPQAVGAVPFVAVGFPDHASRQDAPTARQLTGSILLGSFLGGHEMELSLSSPAPRQAQGSPWQGISGAGVTTTDGVLVGVCTSHHVPSGAASLTATGFSRLTHDADFARLLTEHGVEPVSLGGLMPSPWNAARHDRVRTHADVVRGLLGRRSYLDQAHLPFVHPGMDHPSHPDRLFGRLSTAGSRGVLLIGPAGSGKTRTSFEVAGRAHRAGWQALHVQPDSAVTVEDVAASVLSCERRRVLLVLDYLDACPQLDLRALAEVLLPEARRRGITLACLASVRPGSLRAVQLRGSASAFDEVCLRDDWPHQSAVITQVIQYAAPKAVRLWGGEALARLCGRRPITALLIARAIEEQDLARLPLPPAVSARPGELLDWLREGMRRDALAATTDPTPSPLHVTSPDTAQLAFAVAVAAGPQPRETVEQAVDTLLSTANGSAGSLGGRRVVDTLISLGWLDETDGQLVVVHDVVTDELLLHALMPPPGWSVDENSAASVFSALMRHPRTFAVLTGHVRRLAADMEERGSTHRIAALERFCREWITAHAGPLGRLLANAGHDGGQALLALVTSRPWHGFDHTVWERLVEPWLARAEADHIAQPFLTAALQSVDRAPTCLVEAAVGWLLRRGEQTDTEHLLLALLDRPDLTPEAEDVAVDRTLAWVPSRPGWRHTPALMKRLLRMDHTDDRLGRVVEVVRDWLTPHRSFGVAPVVRAFLQREDVGAAARQEIVDRMLTWLRAAHRTGSDAGPELCALLEYDGLAESDRAELTRCALDWLEQQRSHPSAGRVLRNLLSKDGCPPDLRPRLVTFAQSWATGRAAGLPAQSGVLHALLTDGSSPETVASLLHRLTEQPDAPSAPAMLHRLLLHYEHLGRDRMRVAVTLAFTWLDGHPEHEECSLVLGPLLSVPDLSSAQLRHAVRLGTAALLARPDDHKLMAIMLSRLEGLTAEQARTVADVSLEWLACHGGKAQRRVLASFLTRPDLSVEQAHIGIDIALDRLSTETSAKGRAMLSGVLRHPALDEDRRSRAVDCAVRWLREHGRLAKARLVIEDLLTLPALRPDQRGPAIRFAEDWLAHHGNEPFAHRLRTVLGTQPDASLST
ncbi:serine protease [Streptomyces sp. S.PNR 29]|uniref:S1 family peptidase n=1 Tax=Streptomyces sp. S.PNR 29 TaxID=2973805 RepID=UPI0025AF62B2|nr:serine protease [Streptomyces sp. S.PNR 29]MDN0200119.1 serine protease [Streptomyces sp. S.PNR 29]